MSDPVPRLHLLLTVTSSQHQEKYPGYKFQPLRKADKIRIREEKEREKNAAKREKELNRSGGRELFFGQELYLVFLSDVVWVRLETPETVKNEIIAKLAVCAGPE